MKSIPKWSLRLVMVVLVADSVGFLIWRQTRPADRDVTLAVFDRGTVKASTANTRADTV